MRFLYLIIIYFYVCEVSSQNNYEEKVKGMLMGTLIGDALGGPIEFQGNEYVNQTKFPIKIWSEKDSINEYELKEAANRIIFRPYSDLRPKPEPYAMWNENSKPGTITDDSRNKIILLHMLREKLKKRNKKLAQKDVAKAYINWLSPSLKKTHPTYDSLNNEWLKEIKFACQWVNEKRDSTARPPERMWNSLPTCWGQMTNTPLAAVYPNDPKKSYLLSYHLSFFDNAFARDMNASIVAGMSKALTLDDTKMTHSELWNEIITTMQNTDPYRYQDVPWCSRAINKYLAFADTIARQSNGRPKLLFDKLNQAFIGNEKWEAHVVIAVCFSILKICDYDPLASMQLSIEWGWDTDTYPQLLGAFIGAIYGDKIFMEEWKSLISSRLKEDYNEDINEWVKVLSKTRHHGVKNQLWNDK
jgi:ADP-ribosylglycohydrolase